MDGCLKKRTERWMSRALRERKKKQIQNQLQRTDGFSVRETKQSAELRNIF